MGGWGRVPGGPHLLRAPSGPGQSGKWPWEAQGLAWPGVCEEGGACGWLRLLPLTTSGPEGTQTAGSSKGVDGFRPRHPQD